jgi:hypothetical protein
MYVCIYTHTQHTHTQENGPTRKVELQQLMKDLVLTTDMSLHGGLMHRLKA